jgi:CheY-like chemotaxis protein
MTPADAADARLRILFVDDDVELRKRLVAALDPVRFHVVVAEGPPAAMLLTQRQPFDVLVCGRTATLAALHDQSARSALTEIVFARDPVLTSARGRVQVLRRPATAVDLRAALLDAAARST